jgi:hypothetical protein
MSLRTYPTDLVTDPALVAAATAEGMSPTDAANLIGRLKPEQIRGLETWITSPESYGAGVDEWRAKWPQLASRTDQEVRVLMRWLAERTPAIVHDPGF